MNIERNRFDENFNTMSGDRNTGKLINTPGTIVDLKEKFAEPLERFEKISLF